MFIEKERSDTDYSRPTHNALFRNDYMLFNIQKIICGALPKRILQHQKDISYLFFVKIALQIL